MQQANDLWLWFVKWRNNLSCACCNEKVGCAMEFHHVKPSEKKFTIASAVYNGAPLDEVRKELEKCVPMCANCHKQVHGYGVHDFKKTEVFTRDEALKIQLDCIRNYKGRFK